MLPAWLHTPAAIFFVAGGLLTCFSGYRIFRVVLAIYGFMFGVLIASALMGEDQSLWINLLGGLAGAAVMVAAYFAGVALIGAGAGALVVNVIWASLGREPGILTVCAVAIAGALVALVLQRYVLVLATAFGGAWTAVAGGLALAGQRGAGRGVGEEFWLAHPLSPGTGQWWVGFVWLVTAMAGVAVQLGVTARGRK